MPPRRTSRDWRSALAANRATVHDLPAFKSTDIDFHFVLAEIPLNPIFPAIHDAMADWLTNQRDVTLQVAGQVQIAYRAHERIFKAVASRDPDAAERAMAAHLKQLYRVYERVRDGMRAKPADRPPEFSGHAAAVAAWRMIAAPQQPSQYRRMAQVFSSARKSRDRPSENGHDPEICRCRFRARHCLDSIGFGPARSRRIDALVGH